ncbi:MAG: FmdB family zinc ribbon protein [Fimbriimonadaceae bacterium]
MPTYVYECRTCGKVFEVDQRITADALTDCDCGAKGALRRVIQPVAVSFKGAGFHINDYAAKGATTDASEGKPTETAPTTPADSDSKPAEPKPAESKSTETKAGEGSTPNSLPKPDPK